MDDFIGNLIMSLALAVILLVVGVVLLAPFGLAVWLFVEAVRLAAGC